ncbi:regulatory protein, luxR family [Streptomyces sp. 2131.1]|uniref:helix-turn-helix transcriptional regulator n=1 Tax=Streptomyces sp. 2131.1 TaxID=1855346 RepID=UPI0008952FBB|nr:regulatory protein, luxR family [Streptomyces sp. 2131.1]
MDGLTDGDLAALCELLGRLGWAEAFLGRYADAERRANRGLRIARNSGQVYVLPLLLLCKAHVRIQVCRLRSARDLADEAEDIARGIGSSELWQLLETPDCLVGLAELTRPPSPDAVGTVSWSANLTPRAREIAGLVAEGLTNQAIASRPYLSHRTVETHVTRVLRKAGVATRTALAALMARPVQPAGEPTYPNP